MRKSSALTAASREDIAGLILCFPALDKGESTRSAFQSKDEIPATVDMFGVTTGRKLWESLYEHSQIVLVEGAGHGFSGEDEKTVLKSVYAFMHKRND